MNFILIFFFLEGSLCFRIQCASHVLIKFVWISFEKKKNRLQCHVKGSSLIAFNILK